MDLEESRDSIDRTIESLTSQIELLSKKCCLEANKSEKNYKFETLIEASSIMLQLSRTLNELIITKNVLNNNLNGSNQIDSVFNSILGRRS